MPNFSIILRLVTLSGFLAGIVTAVHAEKSDHDQPVNIEADRMTADDTKKVSYFEGNVILTQGTIHMTADHMTVREDPEGMKYASAFGNPVTFRQKRDGVDEWVDGKAQHVEYNGKIERIELFDRAVVHQGKDEIKGDYLSYDTKTEFLRANGVADEQGGKAPGRVHVVLQPKKDEQKSAVAGKGGTASIPSTVTKDKMPSPLTPAPLILKQDTDLSP
ncbi:lipopolysaccharide transport periplasmic protein LptA [Ferrovum sp.]|uniref:lipopolysaccharide transport periplasmic protein LptA n=1 Tax=Ferrovum sp. TaxID=2609467 RepID=UPI002624EB0B|nr:lipopolysaccharide transport periplasmic protein LptA [Ferrovum sp.]